MNTRRSADGTLAAEPVDGKSLRAFIEEKKASGGPTWSDTYGIRRDVFRGLAALHEQGAVHGSISPASIVITADGAVLASSGPEGDARAYFSPERSQGGPASFEADVYALALSLWEMFTGRAPEPGSNPRARPMREQVLFDPRSRMHPDDLQRLFQALHEDPTSRPRAEEMGRGPLLQDWVEYDPLLMKRAWLDPGPPLPKPSQEQFIAGAQGLLIIASLSAPESIGALFPLDKPVLSIGRGADQDLRLPDASVSTAHAVLRWAKADAIGPVDHEPLKGQKASWVLEDAGSENGSYYLSARERLRRIALGHGAEVQIGECLVKLVSLPTKPVGNLERAQRYLATYDGLTRLHARDRLREVLDAEEAFARWADVPLHLARYRVRGPSGHVAVEPPRAMLLHALGRAARSAAGFLERSLPRLYPIVGARTGPLEFTVSLLGCDRGAAPRLLSDSIEFIQPPMPDHFKMEATLIAPEPGAPAWRLLDGA